MNILENQKLCMYTTLGVGGYVKYMAIIRRMEDIKDAVDFARENAILVFPLGGGSNVIASDVMSDMLVLKMENKGMEIISEDSEKCTIRAYAGQVWDEFVAFTVERGLTGVEALSAIPGTCGATPVQNVGAYGTDVSSTIVSVRAYNMETGQIEELSNTECKFGYRDSVFKGRLKKTHVIESVVYMLHKTVVTVPEYPRVAETVATMRTMYPGDSMVSSVRKAIQHIRAEKLPDPQVIPNVGSFFKNVFVNVHQLERLLQRFPDMPSFADGGLYKIPTGWLIERAGYKGFVKGGVGVYAKNALVLVNVSATSADEVLGLARDIKRSVQDLFGLEIEIEPEIIC